MQARQAIQLQIQAAITGFRDALREFDASDEHRDLRVLRLEARRDRAIALLDELHRHAAAVPGSEVAGLLQEARREVDLGYEMQR